MGTVVLFEDETILREFPPLRAGWAKVGEQVAVPITGRDQRRTLFATLNPKTGRIVQQEGPNSRAASFQSFLRQLRGRYRRWRIWLLLDRHSAHRSRETLEVARRLRIWPLWLPVACPEDNPLENLWRALKDQVAANRSYGSLEELVGRARAWLGGLPPQEVLRISGVQSKNFWLAT